MSQPTFRFSLSIFLAISAAPGFAQDASVNLRGTVTDSAGTPISAATVKLEGKGITATSAADGSFTLTSGTSANRNDLGRVPMVTLREGLLFLSVEEKSEVTVIAFGLKGEILSTLRRVVDAGSRTLALPRLESGVCFFRVKVGDRETLVSAFSLGSKSQGVTLGMQSVNQGAALSKTGRTAAALYDVITTTKSGFLKAYVTVSNSDSANIKIKMLKEGATKFSFFIVSQKAMQELSKNNNGFGGDFRFGETGAGAGLRGADKICATVAEKSMPGSSVKGWRAFLSVTADASGKQVNAIDRVGDGPWYDRTGRLLAPKKADLLAVRPQNGDVNIQNDLPNEDGTPNHTPVPGQPAVDNHHMVTGSSTTGTLASATATCKDWTTAEGTTANGKPSCGFAWPRGGGGSGSGSNWMSTFSAQGCAAGYHFDNTGGQASATGSIIGSNGGYGGFYCFALNP